ncbi:MAG: outer membrane protein, partial [Holosporales bacterium]
LLFAAASSLNAAANFSGVQGGLLLGLSSNRMKIKDVPADPNPPAIMSNGGLFNPSGFAAGIQIGYGTVMNGVFLGLDGRIFKDFSSESANFFISTGHEINATTKGKMPFDVAVKIGAPMENALPFVRFGFAQSSYKTTLSVVATGEEAGKLTTKQSGMIAGIGIDFLATPCVVVGMGYDMTVAQKPKSTTYDDDGNKLKIKSARHTVMLRIAYKM